MSEDNEKNNTFLNRILSMINVIIFIINRKHQLLLIGVKMVNKL